MLFCGSDHSQFQRLFLCQQSYIKLKACVFSQGDEIKAVYNSHPCENGSEIVGGIGEPSLLTSTFTNTGISSCISSIQTESCIQMILPIFFFLQTYMLQFYIEKFKDFGILYITIKSTMKLLSILLATFQLMLNSCFQQHEKIEISFPLTNLHRI